ncbi:hypothetical protein CMI42_00085 [Candidatus Pacearchaeota archaeon]|nr:hypothetical protein [Candidatus Pacearchaeota archaeon]
MMEGADSFLIRNEKMGVKNLILEILSSKWPLTLKKIHNIIKKNYRMKVSSQAVYKSLQDLCNKQVLVKNDREYSLNLDWIKKLKELSKSLENSYVNKNPLIGRDFGINSIETFTFDNLSNLDSFLMPIIEKYLTRKEHGDYSCYSYWIFGWWPLFISNEKYKVLRDIINPKRIYMVLKDNSQITAFCSNFYKKIGINVRTGKEIEDFDFIVLGDLIVQIFKPAKLNNRVISLFNKFNKFEDIDMDKVIEVFEEAHKIEVVILRNKDLSNVLLRKIEGCFN